MRRGILIVIAIVGVGLSAAALGAVRAQALGPPAPGQLVGLFAVKPGACATLPAAPPAGSYFFMQPATGVGFVGNNSSPCSAQQGDYTPVEPGSDGGLVTGQYQPDPVPTFNSAGNSQAGRIIRPVSFFNAKFGMATTCADQQQAPTPDGACPATPSAQFPDYPVPSLSFQPCAPGANGPSASAFCLYGDLRALGATWNGVAPNCAVSAGVGCYDQGAAADSGGKTTCDTGATGCTVSGTFDPTTGEYTLQWKAAIHGGAFNGFIGNWHLAGTYTPGTPKQAQGGTPPQGSSPTTPAPANPAARPATAATQQSTAAHPPGPTTTTLNGVLGIATGRCATGTPAGSYFSMSKGGGPIKNATPNCGDGTYSAITQGTAGLRLGGFQPVPTPTFDGNGNGLARDIIAPVPFFGTAFALATNAEDLQSAPSGPARFPAPAAVLNGTALTVNLSAVNATWNGTANSTCATGQPPGNGCYGQGSPSARGTLDPRTHAYVLEWAATIVGGAFNGATGTWHLEGVFNGQLVTSKAPTGTSASLAEAAALGTVPGFPSTGRPSNSTVGLPPWTALIALTLLCSVAALAWRRRAHAHDHMQRSSET